MKTYFCDACALINQPNYIFELNGLVIIHSITLEELDKKAEKSTTNGKNARNVINALFHLWKMGDLLKGVKINNAIIKLDYRKPKSELLTFGYDPKKHDNMLLAILTEIENENKLNEEEIYFLTGDRGLTIKSCDHKVIYLANSNFNKEEYKNKKYWKKDTIKKNKNKKVNRG